MPCACWPNNFLIIPSNGNMWHWYGAMCKKMKEPLMPISAVTSVSENYLQHIPKAIMERGNHPLQSMERFGYVTLVQCVLETGRTHQIRVHMKHIGHPLFNDDFYGGDKIVKGTVYAKYKQFVENCFAICPRQALHAKTLGFIHPQTGKEMFFDTNFADDMAQVIEKWRKYVSADRKGNGQ